MFIYGYELAFLWRKDDIYKRLLDTFKKNYYIVRNNDLLYCPFCGNTVTPRGSKKRTLIDNDGQKQLFSLKRVYCSNCNSLHIVLPDCFIPHKQYSREVITGIVNGSNNCCAADDSTIYRWKHL